MNKKFFQVLTIVSALYAFLGIFIEKQFIANYYNLFVYGRIFFSISSLVIFYLSLKKNNISKLVHIHLINILTYAIHGQMFIPVYYLAYLQILLISVVCFDLNERFIKFFIPAGSIFMSLAIISSPASYIENPIFKEKMVFDSIISVLFFSLASYLSFIFISKARKEKDVLFEKFIDLGKNSSFIIHDFKGMMMSPIIYIDQLNAEFTKTDPNNEKIEKYIKKLKEELHAIREYSIETTNLTLPSNTQDNEKVFIKDIVKSLQTLFYKQLDGIQINYDEEDFIIYSPSKLKKILHNIILNSIEVLRDNRIKTPTITLSVENHILSVYDNGIGFDEKILKNINKKNGNFITSKKNGSGLGLSVVKELLSKDDIKYHFSNHENNGAKISINFTHQKENL